MVASLRGHRWPWITIAIVVVVAVVATVTIVVGRVASGPARSVTDAASALAAQPGVTLRGSVEDASGARTTVVMTVAADEVAHADLARESGAAAELVSDGARTFLRGNVAWWQGSTVTDLRVADSWVADPPPDAVAHLSLADFTPKALASALQADGGRWARGGDRVVNGRPGTELTNGNRFVVVPTTLGGPPLQMAIPLAAPWAPRAFVTRLDADEPDTPDDPDGPDDAGGPVVPSADLSSVTQPSPQDLGAVHDQAARSARDARAGARASEDGVPSERADVDEFVHWMTADLGPPNRDGKENDTPLEERKAREAAGWAFPEAGTSVMAPLLQLLRSGEVSRRQAVYTILEKFHGADNKAGWRRHIEAAARETEGRIINGKRVFPQSIAVDTDHRGATADLILTYDPVKDPGIPPVLMEIKTMRTSNVDYVKRHVRKGSQQLRTAKNSSPVYEDAKTELHLKFESGALRGLDRADRDQIVQVFKDLNVYQWIQDEVGDEKPTLIIVTNLTTGNKTDNRIEIPVEEINPANPPPSSRGSGGSAPTRPRPVPQAGGAAAAAEPEPEPEEDSHQLLAGRNSQVTAQGPAADSVADVSNPGGIDFSSLSLRYLSDGSTGAPTRYAFSANAVGPGSSPGTGTGTAATQRASDAFFVWLSLRPDAFWVNLNPNQPDKVTDPNLGRTDVGRVLLDADLELKRSMGRLTRPHTPTGDRFWASPDAIDVLTYCAVTRAWIVPGPAEIREEGDAVYVEKAPLVVQTERADVGAAAGQCTPPPPDVAAREDALVRSVVLPEMQREVNEDPRYAALRQVYYARVAAEWYRQRSASHHTEFGNLVNTGDITPWALRTSWTPQEEFEQYRQSFFNGEYRDDVTIGSTTYSVIQGGIDLGAVELVRDTTPAPPGLTETVKQSFTEQSRDPSGQYWLGAVTKAPPPGPPWTLMGLGGAAVLLALAGVGWWRHCRRLQGRWTGPVTADDRVPASATAPFAEPAPSSAYVTSTEYGPLSAGYGPSARYGPSTEYPPSTEYRPSTEYGPLTEYGPSTEYGPASVGCGTAAVEYGPASTEYGPYASGYGRTDEYGPRKSGGREDF
ncbi:hypothetical protein [Actinomycetospora sp. CA-084318]|uniref:hypothetical protein n=1 Tax=Actinomycetospora sp. CA-084318 TaxID=3239892 RepID=UPI003D98256A